MMLDVYIIGILFWLDIILLKFMPGFYASVGIPLLRREIKVRPDVTLADIGVYIGIQEDLIYKKYRNTLVFRSKFTYRTFRSIYVASSIIKGDIIVFEGTAVITQRLNMTAIFMCFFILSIFFRYKIDLFGCVLAIIISLIVFVMNFGQKIKMKEVCNSIERNVNYEKIKSNWPD